MPNIHPRRVTEATEGFDGLSYVPDVALPPCRPASSCRPRSDPCRPSLSLSFCTAGCHFHFLWRSWTWTSHELIETRYSVLIFPPPCGAASRRPRAVMPCDAAATAVATTKAAVCSRMEGLACDACADADAPTPAARHS